MEYRAYLMRLKKNRIKDYVEIHKKEKIWTSVVEGLIKSGIKKMIIFQLGKDLVLFEEAEDLKKASKYLSSDKESARWENMIGDWMEEHPEFNKIQGDLEFKEVPVVFYFKEGELLH